MVSPKTCRCNVIMNKYTVPNMPLKPLARISPSRYLSMQNCTLREVWTANPEVPKLLPISPAAKVGIVAHKILELVGRGVIKDENMMSEHWEKEILSVEQLMKNNLLERHLVPLAKSTRNYEVKRQLCFHMAKKLFGYRHFQIQHQGVKTEYELWVETDDKKIGAKIDVVRHNQDGIQIIDYKTGAVIDTNFQDAYVKKEYQQQLKLYAVIYQSARNVWPVRLTVIDPNQQDYDIQFTRSECLTLLQRAKEFLKSINGKILEKVSASELAQPSPDTCKYCRYRPGCTKYWSHRNDTSNWPTDCYGIIKDKFLLGNGNYRIVLGFDNNEISIRGLSKERFPFLEDVGVKKIILCNLTKDSLPGYFVY